MSAGETQFSAIWSSEECPTISDQSSRPSPSSLPYIRKVNWEQLGNKAHDSRVFALHISRVGSQNMCVPMIETLAIGSKYRSCLGVPNYVGRGDDHFLEGTCFHQVNQSIDRPLAWVRDMVPEHLARYSSFERRRVYRFSEGW
jgi:hypothetical protein